MQPCGQVMDFARRPFTARCQFSPVPGTPPGKLVFWGTPLKGRGPVTVFNNRWWNTEKTDPPPLGGLVRKPRGYNGLWSVPGVLPGHQCGTDEMFVQGYDPAMNPPTPPGLGVIPPCCPSAFAGRVAAAVYPSSIVLSPAGPIVAAQGGLTIGGAIAATVGPLSAPQGGLVIGGQVGAVFPFAPTVQGGITVGGQVQSFFPFHQFTAGGITVGGQVQSFFPFQQFTAGGITVGGSITAELSLAASLVQFATGVSQGTGTVSATWGVPTTAGNLLVAVVASRFPPTSISAPAAWTAIYQPDVGANWTNYFAIGSAASRSGTESFSTPTVSGQYPYDCVVMMEFKQGRALTGLDNGNRQGQATTSFTSPSCPVSVAGFGELLIAAITQSGNPNPTFSAQTNGFVFVAQPAIELAGNDGFTLGVYYLKDVNPTSSLGTQITSTQNTALTFVATCISLT